MAGARQWLDWARQAVGRSNLSDTEFQTALDSVSASLLFAQGKSQEAANILLRLHQQSPSEQPVTYLLADSLIQANRAAEANPYIDSLASTAPPGALLALRLRAHLLAQQGNYVESAALSKQICARPDATAADWNDLAWTTIFTRQNAKDALAAAEKAAQLTNFANAPILHTLAITQAGAGQLKDAIATGYKFAALSGDPGEMHTIFGRITEELGLFDVARQYYALVPPQDSIRLSNYSFAQLRLAALQKPQTSTPTSQ
jgi:Flp pilus assembly protein TadD